MTYTRRVHSVRDMTEQSERLSRAIKDAGISMKEMCERWGWSYNTLKSNANGNMPFSYPKAHVYAGRLKVRAEWLYSGEGEVHEPAPGKKRPAQEVPVIAWVQAGQLADVTAISDMPEMERVVVDGLPKGEWFATDVRSDSMDRVAPEGARIFVNARERNLIPGGFFLFSNRGETTFKRYYDDPVPRLEPYSWNPANRPIYPDKKEKWNVIGRVYRSVLDIK